MEEEYGETTHFPDVEHVEMESRADEESSCSGYTDAPYLGPSTSAFSNFDILDLEAASKNHVSEVNEKEIEEETQNIMEDVICKEQQKKSNTGIILQIVNEKGNLKSKQMPKQTRGKKSKIGYINSKLKTEDVTPCSECLSYFENCEETMDICVCGNVPLFVCEKCEKRLETLNDLLQHIKEEHEDLQVPPEYEILLNKQLLAIEKVKSTAHELIDAFKFSAVRALLETSKKSLDSFKMDIFGKGETNIFRIYLMSVYKDIFNVLNKHDVMEIGVKKGKKKNNVSMEKENWCADTKNKKRIQKDSLKKCTKRIKKMSMEFSSEDELCLKDSVLKFQEAKVLEDGEVVGKLEEECEELCLQFYAVPYKASGESISLYEMECLGEAVRRMWEGIKVDLSPFTDIMIRRFEREVDEVLPPDVLFAGYAAKENISIFTQPKQFAQIFDENFLLNDGIKPHKIKTKKKSNEASLIEIDIMENVTGGRKTLSESEDEPITTKLIQTPGHKSVSLFYGKCDICGKECSKKKEFIKHMNDNHIELWRRYTCKVCGIRMFPRERLWKHFKLHTNMIQECEFCCETFISTQDKEVHINGEHCNDLFVCPLCKSQCEHLMGLQQHFANNHDMYKAAVVQGSVTSQHEASSVGTVADLVCTICSRTFTSLGRLSQHLTTVHQNKKWKK